MFCIAVVKVHAGSPGNWKVEAAQPWRCPRTRVSPISCPVHASVCCPPPARSTDRPGI